MHDLEIYILADELKKVGLYDRVLKMLKAATAVNDPDEAAKDAKRLDHLDKPFAAGDEIRQVFSQDAWTFRGEKYPNVRAALDAAIEAADHPTVNVFVDGMQASMHQQMRRAGSL